MVFGVLLDVAMAVAEALSKTEKVILAIVGDTRGEEEMELFCCTADG